MRSFNARAARATSSSSRSASNWRASAISPAYSWAAKTAIGNSSRTSTSSSSGSWYPFGEFRGVLLNLGDVLFRRDDDQLCILEHPPRGFACNRGEEDITVSGAASYVQ